MARLIAYACMTFMCIAHSLAKGDTNAPVLVALRTEAIVGNRLAKTVDVAELTGGDLATRQRIAQLDIAERDEARIGTVTKSQIALRLRLAGISHNRFQIAGPELALIRWADRDSSDLSLETQPRGDQPIIEVAQAALAEMWQVPPDDVDVRLARPMSTTMRQLLEGDSRITLKPFLPNSATPGPIRVSFGAYRDATLVQRSAVMIEARLHRQVAIAARDIETRRVLSHDDVRLVRQPTEGRVATQAITEVEGKVATHLIRRGAVLLTSDVREPALTQTARVAVIKRGDPVRLRARGNGLTVSVRSCEALENGHEGDMIRIRNLSSKKVVVGRVVRAGEAEIAL